MKPLLIIALIVACLTSIFAQQLVSSPAGIIVTLKKVFLDQYKNLILDRFLSQLKEVKLGDTQTELDARIVKIRAEVKNMQINNAKLGLQQAALQMYSGEPSMALKIDNIGLNFTFQYNINTQPNVLSDQGIGSASFDSLQIIFSCTPQIKKNKLQIVINDFYVNLEEINLVMQGGDISAIVNNFISYFKDYLKQYLVSQMNYVMKETLQYTINQFLAQIPPTFQHGHSSLIVNKMPRSQGAFVTEDYWIFETDGTYSKEGDSLKFNDQAILLPRYVEDGKDMQVFISEYSINSGIEVASQIGILATDKIKISKDQVRSMIAGVEEAFAEDEAFQIEFKASHHQPPSVRISKSGSFFTGVTELHIKNPHNAKFNIASIQLQTSGSISLQATDDFKLIAKLSHVKTHVTKFTPYFYTKTTVTDLQKHEQLFAQLLETHANDQLKQGIQVPVASQLTQYVKEGNVREYDQFIMVEGKVTETGQSLHTLQWSQEFVSSLINTENLKNVFSLQKNKLEMKILDQLHQLNLDEQLINDLQALEKKLFNIKIDL